MADVVEVCGGSHQLLRILNRLGCTSSADTHDRFVTNQAESQRHHSIWDELSKDIFTVVLVDNFDMLQSYSAVYCGDQQRSYHGTTVQVVQPSCNIVNTLNDTNTLCSTLPSTSTNHQQLTDDHTHLTHSSIESDNSPPVVNNLPKQIQRTRECSPDSSPHKLGKVGPKQ